MYYILYGFFAYLDERGEICILQIKRKGEEYNDSTNQGKLRREMKLTTQVQIKGCITVQITMNKEAKKLK